MSARFETTMVAVAAMAAMCLGAVEARGQDGEVSVGPPEVTRVTSFHRKRPSPHFLVFGENVGNATAVHVWYPCAGSKDKRLDEEVIARAAANLPDRPKLPASPPKGSRKMPIERRFEQVLVVKANSGSAENAVGVVWVETPAGLSKPRVVNRAEIWSQSHRTAVPGEHLQIFGHHLIFRFAGTPRIVLRNTASGKLVKAAWADPQPQSMPYSMRFRLDAKLPDDVPAGTYELYIHNNTGNAHGWSNPVPVEIVERRDFIATMANLWNRQGVDAPKTTASPPTRVKVSAEFADGAADATDAIQNAIQRVADAGGGVVVLPPGSYGVNRTIELLPEVVLRGAGRGATRLTVAPGAGLKRAWPDIEPARRGGDEARTILGMQVPGLPGGAVDWEPFIKKAGLTPLVWIRNRGGLMDLTLESGPGVGMLALVARAEHEAVSEDVFFNRVAARFKGTQAVSTGPYIPRYHGVTVMAKTRRFTVYDCEFIAPTALAMLPAYRHEFTRLLANHFEASPRQASNCVVVKSLYHAMIEENTFLHGGRSLISQNGFAHNWVFQNVSEGIGRAGNGCEQFMSEYGKSMWTGRAAGVSRDGVTLPGDAERPATENFDEHDWFVYVMHGRGLGQYRRIASIDGNKVKLAEPWAATPDRQSHLALLNCTHHNLWINNTAKDGDGISQFAYGSAIENIIAGHLMMNNSGLNLHARKRYDKDGEMIRYGVIAFNRLIGNQSRYAGNHDAAFKLWRVSGDLYPLTHLGNELRHNVAVGGGEAALYLNQYGDFWNQHNIDYKPRLAAGFEVQGGYNLVENNLVNGLPVGVRVTRGVGNMVIDNRIDHVSTAEVVDESGNAVVKPPDDQDYEAVGEVKR